MKMLSRNVSWDSVCYEVYNLQYIYIVKIPTKKSKKDEKVNTEDEKPKRTVFRPDHIRKIGFNPIGSTGNEIIKPNKNDTIKVST